MTSKVHLTAHLSNNFLLTLHARHAQLDRVSSYSGVVYARVTEVEDKKLQFFDRRGYRQRRFIIGGLV